MQDLWNITDIWFYVSGGMIRLELYRTYIVMLMYGSMISGGVDRLELRRTYYITMIYGFMYQMAWSDWELFRSCILQRMHGSAVSGGTINWTTTLVEYNGMLGSTYQAVW